MPKSRTEKIATIEEQILKLQEQRKLEMQKHQQEERKAREKRLRSRGEVLEKVLPDTIMLTVEQFTKFLNKTTANTFGRDKLAEILEEGEVKSAPSVPPPTSPSSTPTPSEKSAPPSTPNEKLKSPQQQLSNEKPTSAPNSNESKK